MSTIKVSSKYQIVIPKEIRQQTGIKPGIKLQAIAFNDRIELIPIKSIQSLKGSLKGIDTSMERDEDRL